MPKLFLLRHIKSQWNEENRFAGWTDIPLARGGFSAAAELAAKIFPFNLDKIYSSSLFRNKDTLARIFEAEGKYPIFVSIDGGKAEEWGNYTSLNNSGVPVFVTEKLNERYYGQLQGENKEVAMKKYGKEKVHLWRRSYNEAPPGGESLKDVFERTTPFYKKFPEKDLKAGKNVLIVASHNSLRAISKYVEKISDDDVINFEIPYGGLVEYELDDSLNLKNKEIS